MSEKPASFFIAPPHKASIIGEWKYSFPFYSSELVFKENGAFSFHERGCMEHGYCEGRWEKKGDAYVLTSFEQYKHQKEYTVTRGSIASNKRRVTGKGKEYVLDLSALEQNVEIKIPDTANIYFDKVSFLLKENTLLRLDETGRQTIAKFIKDHNR